MRVVFALAALGLGIVLAVPPSSAQSLGEAAEKAREKRKSKSGKVLTEEDLRKAKGGSLSMPTASGSAEAAPAEGAPPAEGAAPAGAAKTEEKSEEEIRAEAAKAWRERLEKAQAEVTRLRAELQRLEGAAGDLTGPLYGGARQELGSQIEQTKQQLAAAEQQVAQIEEEGRRQRFR